MRRLVAYPLSAEQGGDHGGTEVGWAVSVGSFLKHPFIVPYSLSIRVLAAEDIKDVQEFLFNLHWNTSEDTMLQRTPSPLNIKCFLGNVPNGSIKNGEEAGLKGILLCEL